MMREPLKVIADILAAEMMLTPGQIMLSNQTYVVPTTEGLYIVVGYLSSKFLGVTIVNTPTTSGMTETQCGSLDHTIQIDAMSFNDDARLRKEEIILALNSNTAEQLMGQNLISISRLPSQIQYLPEPNETKMLQRYSTTMRVKALSQKIINTDYFNQFQTPEVHPNV